MADGSAWEPILEGEQAAAARAAIHDVARAIADGHPEDRAGFEPADRVLFWAYVAGAIDEEWTNERYDEATTILCESLGRDPRIAALYGGIAGVGWSLAHVSEEGAADEVLAAIDAALFSTLAAERWTADYDLISGLVGYGVYFIERAQSDANAAQRGLSRVVDHLLAIAEETPHGLAWFTRPELLPRHQREVSPNGYFNHGLAHGVPGVIALLARIAARPDGDGRARGACESALRWMRAQQLPPNPYNRFGSFHRRDEPAEPSRTAWCYGDPGVAVACWGASAELGLDVEPWRAIVREAATRPFENCGSRDSGLCHGHAGLGHIFNRCYQASRESVFRDAARRWFAVTLEQRRPEGIVGFAAYDGAARTYRAMTDIVEGAPGVALALLAAVEPVEPRWDRRFLLDLP